MTKEFKTINQQLSILKGRGMDISDEVRAAKVLESENYYNIINGYKELFIDYSQSGADEKYLAGTDFFEIYALYSFDRELRSLFLKYILEIENNIKSVLAYEFSKKYGHDNYLKISNFNTNVQPWEKRKTASQKTGEISDLIVTIQKEISKQLSKNNPMIAHYMLEEGYIPLWVLVNILTLGTVSIFYQNMKQVDQNNVGRKFSLHPDEMQAILSVLSVFRNQCAHDGRLYNLKAVKRDGRANSIKTNQWHHTLNIPVNAGNNPIYGKNDLFAIVIIFKLLLYPASFGRFCDSLKCEIDNLAAGMKTVSIDAVLHKMGFPINWLAIQ